MNLQVGKFYKDSEGNKVEILKIDLANTDYPALGVRYYKNNNYSWHLCRYDLDGRVGGAFELVSEWEDPKVVTVVGYVNVYRTGHYYFYPNEGLANAAAIEGSKRIVIKEDVTFDD